VTFAIRRLVGEGSAALAVFAPLLGGILFYGAFVRGSPLWAVVASLRREA
jgi:hypothetical protein